MQISNTSHQMSIEGVQTLETRKKRLSNLNSGIFYDVGLKSSLESSSVIKGKKRKIKFLSSELGCHNEDLANLKSHLSKISQDFKSYKDKYNKGILRFKMPDNVFVRTEHLNDYYTSIDPNLVNNIFLKKN